MKKPSELLQQIIAERYLDALYVIWAGSLCYGYPTDNSDLDIVVVYRSIEQAYRDAFIIEGWMVDAFIHDPSTLRYYFNENYKDGIPGLLSMVAQGTVFPQPNAYSIEMQQLASELYLKGPKPLNQDEIDKQRFFITDLILDIEKPVNASEQLASCTALFEKLGLFYQRTRNKWYGNGKHLVRFLKKDSEEFSNQYIAAFQACFSSGKTELLSILVDEILAPLGGRLFDGYHSKAPKEHKLNDLNQAAKQIK